MSKQDDALPLSQPRRPRGPSAAQLRANAAQDAWLQEKINWQILRKRAYRFTRDPVIGGEFCQELHNDMVSFSMEELLDLRCPQAYATTCLEHRLLNWRRKASRTASSPDNFDSTPDPTIPLEQLWETHDEAVKLLADLPAKWYEPLVLCKVHEYTVEETAAELNLTVDVVKKRVARALHYLRVKAETPQRSLLHRFRNFIGRKEHHHG